MEYITLQEARIRTAPPNTNRAVIELVKFSNCSIFEEIELPTAGSGETIKYTKGMMLDRDATFNNALTIIENSKIKACILSWCAINPMLRRIPAKKPVFPLGLIRCERSTIGLLVFKYSLSFIYSSIYIQQHKESLHLIILFM